MKNSDRVLVYQMGKVGSQSVKFSLENNGLKAEHIHWLGAKEPKAEFPTPNNVVLNNINKGYVKYKVIVLVRNPMARNLSAFFQRIRRWSSRRPENMTSMEIQKDFIDRYDIKYADKWFDEELHRFFKFNVYKNTFPHKKGYKVYDSDGHKILIIRLEDTKEKLKEAIKELTGVDGVLMSNKGVYEKRNVGQDFIQKYKEIKKMDFPLSFIEKNYNLKYSNYFYTKKEIENFKKEWSYV